MTLNVVSWRRTSDVIDFLFMFFSKTVQEMYRYTEIALELTVRACFSVRSASANTCERPNQIKFYLLKTVNTSHLNTASGKSS